MQLETNFGSLSSLNFMLTMGFRKQPVFWLIGTRKSEAQSNNLVLEQGEKTR